MSKKKFSKMSFTVHSFMCEEMELTGAELLTFAIIYSFSKSDAGIYYGTQSYLAAVSGTSESTVKRVLARLKERGYIEKTEKGDKEGYIAVLPPGVSDEPCDADSPPNDEQRMLLKKERMEELNIDVRSKIYTERPKYEFYTLGRHGFVSMTAGQYKKLTELVSSEVLTAYINKLELLIRDKDYRTYSPYKTIKKWIYEDAAL